MSATRCRILIDQGVNVLPEMSGPNTWCTGERGKGSFGRYEHPLSQGNQLADGHTVARNDECLPLVQGTHDSPAFVAELSLGDASTHRRGIVARALRHGRSRLIDAQAVNNDCM
jgi:hypothetical protein